MRASRIGAVMRQVQDIDAPTPGEATAGPGPGETRARAWPRAVRAAFLGVLLALGLAGFTGSSGWYEVVRDPLNRPETRSEDRNVVGRSRPIRSDEYAIELPVARAQQLARPAHPLVNVGIGLGDLQRTPLAESPPEGPRLDVRAALIAAATLGALLAWARLELPSGKRPSWWGIAMAAALLVAAAAVVGTRWAGLALALAWLVPVAATNVQVNPLLRSRDLFHEEEAHALIRRALADRPGRILDFSTHSGSALAGHGWPVLAAVHMAPQESLWRFLAPATPGLGRQMWNRFAHVGFVPFPFAPRLPTVDSLTAQLDPCNPRLAAIGVNHVLTRPDMWLPPRCRDEYDVRAAGELLLWSRRKPVSAVGVARGERPTSALEFDWYGGAGARLSPERDRLVLEAPGGERVHYAFAFNLGLVDRISCQGAVATTLDTHVVVSPAGSGPARCEVRYLGTLGAMRRLLARGGNP